MIESIFICKTGFLNQICKKLIRDTPLMVVYPAQSISLPNFCIHSFFIIFRSLEHLEITRATDVLRFLQQELENRPSSRWILVSLEEEFGTYLYNNLASFEHFVLVNFDIGFNGGWKQKHCALPFFIFVCVRFNGKEQDV